MVTNAENDDRTFVVEYLNEDNELARVPLRGYARASNYVDTVLQQHPEWTPQRFVIREFKRRAKMRIPNPLFKQQ